MLKLYSAYVKSKLEARNLFIRINPKKEEKKSISKHSGINSAYCHNRSKNIS